MFGKTKKINVRPSCIPLETVDETPGERGEYYVSARVISHHLPTNGGRKRHGFIQWSIRCPDGQGSDVEFQRLEVPGGLSESAGKRSDRIYEANRQILGTVPFHDDIFFEIALSSIQAGGKFDPYLKLLADMSTVASRDSFISSFVPGMSLVSRGLTYAAEQQESTPIDLAVMCRFSFDGATFKPGKYAAIYGPFDASNSDALQLDEKSGELFIVKKNKRSRVDWPYVTFSIDIEQSRSDWFRVPDILTAWQELRLEYVEGGTQDGIENAFRRFERICLSSPDLIRSDAQKLVTMMSELFERSPSSQRAEMAGMSQPEMLGIKLAANGARARMADLRKVSSLKQLLSVDRLSDLATRTYQHVANNAPQGPSSEELPTNVGVLQSNNPAANGSNPLNEAAERVFQKALSFAKGWEGGYVDHPSDHGGKTNFGIIQPTLNAYTRRKGLPPKSVREISFEEAAAIYREDFFIAGKCEQLPENIAVAYFDARVNHHPRTAGKLLQKGINAQPELSENQHIQVDGIVGSGTIKAANEGDEQAILKGYCDAREAHFRHRAETVAGQDAFINGWLNRVNDLRKYVGLPVGEAFIKFVRQALPKPADFLEYISELNSISGFNEPLNADEIEAALAEISGNGLDAGTAMTDLIGHIRSLPRADADTTAIGILAKLRGRRSFRAVAEAANGLMIAGIGAASAWRHRAQALLELKRFDEAVWTAKEINQRFAHAGDANELRTARTILARTSKQKYVDAAITNPEARSASDLVMAAQIYMDVYEEKRTSTEIYYYEGLNALAVLMRSDRDGVPALPHINRNKLRDTVESNARHVVDHKLAENIHADADEDLFWAILTLAEIAIAKRDIDAARLETQKALDHATVGNLFNLGAFARQLREVWQLDREPQNSPWSALLNSIELVIIRLSQNGTMALTKPQLEQLQENFDEKTFEHGTKRAEALLGSFKLVPAMAYIEYLKSVCGAIARIKSSRRPMAGSGTGFLMEGGTLSPKWQGKTVLMTNFHVVSPNGVYHGSLIPEEVQASFTFLLDRPVLTAGNILWSSAYGAHDCTILEIDISGSPDLAPLKHFKSSPPAKTTDPSGKPIGQVNVIGHPAGREMELGTTGLDLHELTHTLFKTQAGPPIPIPVLRYNSPTEPGSSGSPVFDMQTLELCGLHHASLTYPREISTDKTTTTSDPSTASLKPARVRAGGYRDRISTAAQGGKKIINQPANEGIWFASIVDAIAKYPDGLA